ncbi:MAG TPA: hypothetical protein VFU26_01535 [Gaiellaceae bacterium]|jgi:hypothetical protein|nr:hypothetical protein [Gaiellaceae bacterium]
MARRFLPAALVAVALVSDTSGFHGLALVCLFGAIPAAFVLALDCYGDALAGGCSLFRPVVAGLSLVLLVLSAALRSPAVAGGVPALAVSALVFALALYVAVALGALLPGARTLPESA